MVPAPFQARAYKFLTDRQTFRQTDRQWFNEQPG